MTSFPQNVKSPLGIYASPSRSTVQIRISDFNLVTTSLTFMPTRLEPSGSLNVSSSTRPFPKVSIFIAEGKRKTLAISSAAANSGLIIISSPSSSFRYGMSALYSGLVTRAITRHLPVFLAIIQQSRLSSSESVTAISKSAESIPASTSVV